VARPATSVDYVHIEEATKKMKIIHGNNLECPEVVSGATTHCPGHDEKEFASVNQLTDDRSLCIWIENIHAMGAGHFLSAIREAAIRADSDNQRLMYPLLKRLQDKYPRYSGTEFPQ
jgi:hypothetical protein